MSQELDEMMNRIKGTLRVGRMASVDDPFFEFQQGNVSKSRLLQHIVETVKEEIKDHLKTAKTAELKKLGGKKEQ